MSRKKKHMKSVITYMGEYVGKKYMITKATSCEGKYFVIRMEDGLCTPPLHIKEAINIFCEKEGNKLPANETVSPPQPLENKWLDSDYWILGGAVFVGLIILAKLIIHIF